MPTTRLSGTDPLPVRKTRNSGLGKSHDQPPSEKLSTCKSPPGKRKRQTEESIEKVRGAQKNKTENEEGHDKKPDSSPKSKRRKQNFAPSGIPDKNDKMDSDSATLEVKKEEHKPSKRRISETQGKLKSTLEDRNEGKTPQAEQTPTRRSGRVSIPNRKYIEEEEPPGKKEIKGRKKMQSPSQLVEKVHKLTADQPKKITNTVSSRDSKIPEKRIDRKNKQSSSSNKVEIDVIKWNCSKIENKGPKVVSHFEKSPKTIVRKIQDSAEGGKTSEMSSTHSQLPIQKNQSTKDPDTEDSTPSAHVTHQVTEKKNQSTIDSEPTEHTPYAPATHQIIIQNNQSIVDKNLPDLNLSAAKDISCSKTSLPQEKTEKIPDNITDMEVKEQGRETLKEGEESCIALQGTERFEEDMIVTNYTDSETVVRENCAQENIKQEEAYTVEITIIEEQQEGYPGDTSVETPKSDLTGVITESRTFTEISKSEDIPVQIEPSQTVVKHAIDESEADNGELSQSELSVDTSENVPTPFKEIFTGFGSNLQASEDLVECKSIPEVQNSALDKSRITIESLKQVVTEPESGQDTTEPSVSENEARTQEIILSVSKIGGELMTEENMGNEGQDSVEEKELSAATNSLVNDMNTEDTSVEIRTTSTVLTMPDGRSMRVMTSPDSSSFTLKNEDIRSKLDPKTGLSNLAELAKTSSGFIVLNKALSEKKVVLTSSTQTPLSTTGRTIHIKTVNSKGRNLPGKLLRPGQGLEENQSKQVTLEKMNSDHIEQMILDNSTQKEPEEVKQEFVIVKLPEGQEIKQRFVKSDSKSEDVPFSLSNDGVHTCGLCDYKTDKKGNWYKHKKKHMGSKTHKCQFCSYVAATSSNLKRHQNIHMDIREHQCNACGQTFRQKIHLERHIKYKHEEKQVKCPLCNYVCANENPDLKIHIKRRHLPPDEEENQDVRAYTCEECGLMTVSKKDLRQHMKFHKSGPELKLFCEQCSFVTDCDSRLKRHMLTHSNERPFQCGLCDYRGSQKEHVLRHMRSQHHIAIERKSKKSFDNEDSDSKDDIIIHEKQNDKSDYSSQEKIFACNHCTMKFAKLINLYKHLHGQHKEVLPSDPEEFLCVVCDFKTSSKKNLLVHMRKHNLQDQVPPSHVYSCVLCRYMNPRRRNLFQHMKKKHGIEIVIKDDGSTSCFVAEIIPSSEDSMQNISTVGDVVTATTEEPQLQIVTDEANMKEIQNVISVEDLAYAVSHPKPNRKAVLNEKEERIHAKPSTAVKEHEAAEAIEGLQALAEQPGIIMGTPKQDAMETEVITMDTTGLVEILETEKEASTNIQLSQEQLMSLSTGDFVEINGEMYKVEISTEENSITVQPDLSNNSVIAAINNNTVVTSVDDEEVTTLIQNAVSSMMESVDQADGVTMMMNTHHGSQLPGGEEKEKENLLDAIHNTTSEIEDEHQDADTKENIQHIKSETENISQTTCDIESSQQSQSSEPHYSQIITQNGVSSVDKNDFVMQSSVSQETAEVLIHLEQESCSDSQNYNEDVQNETSFSSNIPEAMQVESSIDQGDSKISVHQNLIISENMAAEQLPEPQG